MTLVRPLHAIMLQKKPAESGTERRAPSARAVAADATQKKKDLAQKAELIKKDQVCAFGAGDGEFWLGRILSAGAEAVRGEGARGRRARGLVAVQR